MNKKTLTPEQAWQDFWTWIKQQPRWSTISRKERQYLDKTNRAVLSGKAGTARISAAFNEYAPGRYLGIVLFEVVG